MLSIFKRVLAILAVLTMCAPLAHAGGLERRGSLKDGPYSAYSWTGAYIGVTAGYGWGDSRFDDGARSNPFDIDGLVIGGTIGYNLQLQGNVVIGVEADISYSDISGSFGPGNLGQPNGLGWGCGTGACVTDVNWFGTLRGRLGYAAADSLLIYATGGLAYGSIDSAIRNDADWITGNTAVGWTVGGGIEYVLRPGWTAKLEYLHVDLGWTDRNAAENFRSDAVFDVVRLGLNYRLGSMR
jgi:outer membrane immunogenic protein